MSSAIRVNRVLIEGGIREDLRRRAQDSMNSEKILVFILGAVVLAKDLLGAFFGTLSLTQS